MKNEAAAASLLQIRPPEPGDAEALFEFELANRAYFETWINPRDPVFYALDAVRAAIGFAAAARREDRGYQYLALAEGRIVGRVNLHAVRRPHFQCAELGYRIGERDAGRGYASAAVALCLREAFGPLRLHRVEATARPENLASARVLERNGFAAFGRSRRCFELHGQWFDLIHYERHADALQ